jgi:hypothetical protein
LVVICDGGALVLETFSNLCVRMSVLPPSEARVFADGASKLRAKTKNIVLNRSEKTFISYRTFNNIR